MLLLVSIVLVSNLQAGPYVEVNQAECKNLPFKLFGLCSITYLIKYLRFSKISSSVEDSIFPKGMLIFPFLSFLKLTPFYK